MVSRFKIEILDILKIYFLIARADNNALSSIDGATALKLDESYEIR